MLPIGGILIAIFAGWIMSREASRDELEIGDGNTYKTWRVLTKFIAPALVCIVILQLFGLLDPIFALFAPLVDLFNGIK